MNWPTNARQCAARKGTLRRAKIKGIFMRNSLGLVAVTVFTFLEIASAYAIDTQSIVVNVLSSRPDMVSEGSALVSVDVPAGVNVSSLKVRAGTIDETTNFKPLGDRIVGLVSDLKLGKTILTASAGDKVGTLALTNHDKNGPIISGPHQMPFICQTQTFKLP